MLLVTGDEASCREGRELLGDGLTTVAVKRGFSSSSARNLTPARARELIEDGRAAGARPTYRGRAVRPGQPVRDQGRVQEHERSPTRFASAHGVERVDERTIVSRADTWWEAWKQFYF